MRKFTLLLIVLLLLSACGEDKKKSTEEEAVATLTVLEETATLMTIANPDTPQELQIGDTAEVREGDQVVTSLRGEAVLTFYTGAETHLMPGTSVMVQDFDRTGSSTQISVNLVIGQTVTNIDTALDANSSHEVNTPVATIVVRGTTFAVFVRPDNLTQVATLDGMVNVTAVDQKSADIPYGYGVAVAPEGTLGEVKVWGLAQIDLTTPSSEAPPLPVTFEKIENGQTFNYRIGDLMAVPLGSYSVTIHAAVPVVVENIDFPVTLSAGTILPIPVTLSAIVLTAPEGTGDLNVHLEQGTVTGDVVTAPGVPMLVGPGTWHLTVTSGNQPEQSLDITVAEGETTEIPLGR
jgi:hypothetical protein